MSTQRKKRKSKINPLLEEQLNKIKVQPDGIPSGVLSKLCDLAESEVVKVEKDLAKQIDELKEEAEDSLRERLAEIITLEAVAKAFVSVANAATTVTPILPARYTVSWLGRTTAIPHFRRHGALN